MPASFRWICNMIYRTVTTRFPDAGYTAVGGFIFLRFLCPAIVAPDSNGICPPIENPEVRRGLLLCTKITHNLANDVAFGNKETYMVPLNRFITENRPQILRFLAEISEMSDDVESIYEGGAKSISSNNGAASGRPSTDYVTSEADTDASNLDGSLGTSGKEFVAVQKFIFDHIDKLETYLSREPMVRMHAQVKPNDRRKLSDGKPGSKSKQQQQQQQGTGGSPSLTKSSSTESGGASGDITSTENLFTQVSFIMRQLGPPTVANTESSQVKVPSAIDASGEDMFYVILRRDAGRSTDAIAKKAIIYMGGVSREKRPVLYVIVRRMQMQYLDMDAVMLHVLRLLEPLANKSFEVFFDLTQFGPANEVPLQWITQLKRVIPESIINNIQAVYWYNVNTYFRKYVKQANMALPPRLAKRSVFPHSLSDLHEFLASPQADLPPGTVSLDGEGGINISPVTRVSSSHAPLPCMVKVTPEAIQITALRRQEVFGLSTYFNDVYHITEIADLQLLPSTSRPNSSDADGDNGFKGRTQLQRTASRSSENERTGAGKQGKADDHNLVSIRFEGSNSALMFSSPKSELMFKAIRSARARYTTHTAVASVPERVIRPSDVPGTLLNVALLNCGAEHALLRIAAYRMLTSIVATFHIDVGHELAYAIDLCLPPNPLQFINRVCTRLSLSAPDMTLELLSEALVAFNKSAPSMKIWILQYIQPWLLCLGQYTHDSVSHPDALNRTQDIVRNLIRLHLKEPALYMHFKEHVWMQLARVEELTEIVLDMFLQVALEYGALTIETELIADMLATVAGRNPRYNKLVTRLRKLIAQTCTMNVVYISTHQLWPEIAVHMRLLLPLTFSNRALADEYLPDIAFITCMLLKSGPGMIQATLHGIVMHVVHSLALSQCNGMIIDQTFSSSITGASSFAGNPVRQFSDADNGVAAESSTGAMLLTPYAQLAQQLADLSLTKTKFSFGLRSKTTSAVTFIASSYTRGGAASTLNPQALMEYKDELNSSNYAQESPQDILAAVESAAQIFLRIMENPAFANGRGNAWRARWTTLVTASTFVFNPAIQPRAFTLLGKLASHDEVDDDLLYQTLATLRGALASFGETDESLPISVLTCLVSMVSNLPPDSSYLASLFWLGIAVLQIGNVPLYKVGLSLVSKVLRTLDVCGAFSPENGEGFQDFLMSARVAVEKAADMIDETTRISFRSSFSSALCLLLLRGMEDVVTKDETYEVLIQIIGIVTGCRRWQLADAANEKRLLDLVLPYLILIIPTASARNELVHVFTMAGLVTSTEIKQSLEHGGYVRLLEQIHKVDIKRECQTDYILYPSILAAMLHKVRVEHDIMILYSIFASNITWVDNTMSLLVIESLAPTMSNVMHSTHSPKLIQKLHDIMVRLAITRPSFDPDVFIQQQRLLQQQQGGGSGGAHASATRKSVSANAYNPSTPVSPNMPSGSAVHRSSYIPPSRGHDDGSERNSTSVMSAHSSSPSVSGPESSFDRSMVPAHKEYLTEIGFGGLGRAIAFETNPNYWKELAGLASMVVDNML
ncbi:Ras GTPase activating protein ira2 [Dipsacomyces acuminosporus]|nr:Ras GTPase activating protein ira2 [Dipsacomyces acuminosporus]